MAEVCCGLAGENEDPGNRRARRRRMELRNVMPVKVDAAEDAKRRRIENGLLPNVNKVTCGASYGAVSRLMQPKYGMTSVCGRRRDMEDTVAIHPSFLMRNATQALHYFGVYDGHGCSHVATRCRERFHELVKEELKEEEGKEAKSGEKYCNKVWWKNAMERSFSRMDDEVIAMDKEVVIDDDDDAPKCRCELKSPECNAVGSTAVIAIVTPDRIVVANCGDSRAVLCRNGRPVPLSQDHKPDRPDELNRIQAAGGRVIFWEGARVLGVLAMSRAIGDNYLKPYVTWEPEVTVTERKDEDECLILASDGLWDVVSNETACGVARMCLRNIEPEPEVETASENVCADASMLLTKLALARTSCDNVSVVVVDIRKGVGKI